MGSFTRKQAYGLTVLVSTDERVKNFLKSVLSQIEEWLVERKVKKLVVVLTSVETKEVLERWEFKVEYETEESDNSKAGNENTNPNSDASKKKGTKSDRKYCDVSKKDEKAIHKDLEVPVEWGETDACIIQDSEEVKLRSFSTNI